MSGGSLAGASRLHAVYPSRAGNAAVDLIAIAALARSVPMPAGITHAARLGHM